MRKRLRAFLSSKPDISFLIVGIGFPALGFLGIASLVVSGNAYAADLAILGWFRVEGDPASMIGPFWFREAIRDITALGSGTILTFIVVCVALILLLMREWATALVLAATTAGGGLASDGLKIVFGRARPEFSLYADQLSASFPSGHAMNSAVVFLTIGIIAARLTVHKQMRIAILSTAIFLTVAVGTTRVLLGVHYPSDVVAGWALGTAWALGWSALALVFQNRGKKLHNAPSRPD